MKHLSIVALAALLLVPSVAWGFNCPVVIKQAEDMIKRAESKVTPETKPLIDEAKKQLAEAKAHHETAKAKKDHGDAVRKARVAYAFAEEAATLQGQ